MEPVNSTQPKNTGYIKGALGAVGAWGAGQVIASGAGLAARSAAKVDPQTKATLTQLSQDVLEKTGLAKKCVEIITVKDIPSLREAFKNPKEMLNRISDFSQDEKALKAYKEEFLSSGFLKKLMGKSSEEFNRALDMEANNEAIKGLAQFKMGLNACFLPNTNKILLPENNLRPSVFHEMGHAMNANFGTVTKQLQKMRGLSTIVPAAVIATSLLNKKKQGVKRQESEMPTNPIKKAFVKTADFVKDHAGLLTGLAFVPMLVEEGCATLKGQKALKSLVKDNVDLKNVLKQVKKTNAIAYASYVLAAVSTVAACKVAINLKDRAQDKAYFKAKTAAEIHNGLQGHQG